MRIIFKHDCDSGAWWAVSIAEAVKGDMVSSLCPVCGHRVEREV